MSDADIVRVAHRLAITMGTGAVEELAGGYRRTTYRLIEPQVLHGLSICMEWQSSQVRLCCGHRIQVFDHRPASSQEGVLVLEATYARVRASVPEKLNVLKKDSGGWLLRMAVIVANPEDTLNAVSLFQLGRQNRIHAQELERKRREENFHGRSHH